MTISLMILITILAVAAGFAAGWIVQSKKLQKLNEDSVASLQEQQKVASAAENQLSITNETLRLKSEQLESVLKNLQEATQLLEQRGMEIATLKTSNENLMEKLQNQKTEIEELQKRLTTEFENIASRILKERLEDFTTSNHKNLSLILDPLKEKISQFEKKVEETYDKDLRDKISLKEEIKKLTELNTQVSDEANNLTKALKGEVKTQGNWGEVILERVLERSGLIKGEEYDTQVDILNNEGQHQRPDVVVFLPDKKHIIIDSKVSLTAYEQYVSAETPEQQDGFLKRHIASLRAHIKELNEKNYQNAAQLNSPDFVLMFLPIEASFSVAVQNDFDLYQFAWDKKVVIVSPTTLLATLQTVSFIWRQENQNRNAKEIARLSKTLHDKFISFTEDMNRIKQNIDKASEAYNEALKKMKDGKGNIIRTAEKIHELGGFDKSKAISNDFEIF